MRDLGEVSISMQMSDQDQLLLALAMSMNNSIDQLDHTAAAVDTTTIITTTTNEESRPVELNDNSSSTITSATDGTAIQMTVSPSSSPSRLLARINLALTSPAGEFVDVDDNPNI